MATLIDVSDVYRETRGLINSIVGKYDYIRFIELDEDNDNELIYTTDSIYEGFYYKPTPPEVGEAQETILFVPENDTIEEAVKGASMLDLFNEDGSFTRFKIKYKGRPRRPSFQWILGVNPNEQAKEIIA